MADDLDTAAQAEQSTPPAKTEEVPNQEGKQAQEEQETPVKATSESQGEEAEKSSSEETGDQSGQEAKPSRVERRIHDLISKVKEVGQIQTPAPSENRSQPVFSKEDIEAGEIDPNTLEQRIQNTVQSEVQKAIQMDRINQQYVSAVRDHQTDLEGVKDIDPDLEAEAAKEYEVVNYQINPLTGQREFVPAVKFSEIVSKIQTRAERLAQKLAEKIAEGNEQFIKKVSSSQAVPSSGAVTSSKSVKPETTNFSEFEKAYSS